MKRRIDFDRYKKSEAAPGINGIIPEDLRRLYCDSNELQSVVKMVDKNNLVFWKSEGNWSMHQMLLALLEITGKADVFISSYAMGETPARVLQQLWQNEVINNIVCVLDSRVEVRTAGSLQLIKGFCARMALVDTHAKVTIIKNDDWNLCVIGSANYTENKRFEAGIICNDVCVAQLHIDWIEKSIKNGNNS